MPMGSFGYRWGKNKGKWNLELKDSMDGSEIDPQLTFLERNDGVVPGHAGLLRRRRRR